jgi:hypothetical protein
MKFLAVIIILISTFISIEAASPTISVLDVTKGHAKGGTLVTVIGSGFDLNTYVEFGGQRSIFVRLVSNTKIKVLTVGYMLGVVDVTVKNLDGFSSLSSAFTYAEEPPVLSRISKSSGILDGNSPITLYGEMFTSNMSVEVGGIGTSGTFVFHHDRQMSCLVPTSKQAGIYDVTIKNEFGEGKLEAVYEYLSEEVNVLPVVNKIYPTNGTLNGNTIVRISGGNLRTTDIYDFGGAKADIYRYENSETVYIKTAPYENEAETTLTILAKSGNVDTNITYKYEAIPPKIQTIYPNKLRNDGPSWVYISGEGFSRDMKVNIGSLECEIHCFFHSGYIRVQAPAQAEGEYTMIITNDFGVAVNHGISYLNIVPSEPRG